MEREEERMGVTENWRQHETNSKTNKLSSRLWSTPVISQRRCKWKGNKTRGGRIKTQNSSQSTCYIHDQIWIMMHVLVLVEVVKFGKNPCQFPVPRRVICSWIPWTLTFYARRISTIIFFNILAVISFFFVVGKEAIKPPITATTDLHHADRCSVTYCNARSICSRVVRCPSCNGVVSPQSQRKSPLFCHGALKNTQLESRSAPFPGANYKWLWYYWDVSVM